VRARHDVSALLISPSKNRLVEITYLRIASDLNLLALGIDIDIDIDIDIVGVLRLRLDLGCQAVSNQYTGR